MLKRFVRPVSVRALRRVISGLLAGVLILVAPTLEAQVTLPPVSIGAGLQTSFGHTEPDGGSATDKFALDHARIYIGGSATEQIKFMFNTDYYGADNKVSVLDAVARIEMSPKFNIWFGRLLPPSDRANLNGPFYAHHWNVYQDGIQNGHPFIHQGRDNGVVYWGDFNKIKFSIGGFDGTSATGRNNLIGAARLQINLWDPESGYYLNGTYYGAKDLLSIGGATQIQDGRTATTVDFLMEKKLPGGGVVTIEGEYANYNRLGGYDSRYAKSQGEYVLASYLFPKQIGMGKIEILGKYANAQFTHGVTPSYHQKTTEINLNYVIKEFNARVMGFYLDKRFNTVQTDTWQAGVGLQIQM